MSDFANQVTMELAPNAHTPDFVPPDWVPQTRAQMTASNSIKQTYRKWDAPLQTIVEMTQAEKDVVDHDQQVAENDQAEDTVSKDQMKALALTTLEMVNRLNAEHGFPAYTWAQWKTKFRDHLDTLTGV